MAKFDNRLDGYVEVKDRVRLFYEAHPDGRLVTTDVRATTEPDGVPRVWVEAAAYRTPDDPLPARGWSWMVLPGSTPYTKGSELENTETSAWGRAIGALNIGIDKSIASANEVRSKSVPADVEKTDDGGLVGTAEAGDRSSSDFLVRNTPDGPALGFRLRGDKGGILVESRGPLAVQLHEHKAAIVGSRVTVWGTIATRTFTAKGGKEVSYQVLDATRVKAPDLDLPVAGEGLTEAESEAIWNELADVAVGT